MIKVVEKKKKKKKQNPCYLLEFSYMIGDGRGHTEEEMTASIEDADIVERFVTLINKLTPTKGHWGVMLEDDRIYKHFEEGQITEDDYKFLTTVMFDDYYDEDDEEENDNTEEENEYKKYSGYFSECVMSVTEYSFLVFEGVDLYYYDEYGIKHETEIIN
jgi:hypothetical protein